MRRQIANLTAVGVLLAGAGLDAYGGVLAQPQVPPPLASPSGLELRVDDDVTAPTLRIVLPGQPDTSRMIVVLFPEHVTAVRHGQSEGRQLYRWEPEMRGERPAWHREGRSLWYERDVEDSIHFTARATLDSDGVRIRYEFRSRSAASYDMIVAVTDPRLTGTLHDVRLERTYVHYPAGFDLLAAETPARLTMPLEQWLPARYLASYTWPVPKQRKERREGIMHYNTRRRVDQPFVATVSSDSAWVVASVTRTTGNVWSNPALTCQHVDPQTSLASGATAITEMKILVMNGSLHSVFQRALQQRASLH